jgi:glycosyltransferase involved in cell wall biosynthesis
MDIGIMPLLDRPFQRGKSGYKLVQYMACGLPVVASPVGVNTRIVASGHNGLLASSTDEWRAALARLLDDSALRKAMGKASRTLAEQSYSLASQAPRVVDLFEAVAAER